MDRFAYALYRFTAAIIRALPLAAGFRIGWLLGALVHAFAWPYRRLVIANLRIAFPEKTPAEIRTLARRHFATLGANLLASIKLPTLSRAEIERVVTVEGLHHMDAQTSGGFVFVISHIGNWEMFAQLTPHIFKCKTGTIYQRLGNPHLDAEVRTARARLGMQLFERKEGFVAASRFLREGGAVGVLVDQHAGDGGLWCPFFGRLASTTTLPATLALRTGAWLMPAAVHTEGVARWRLVIQERLNVDAQSAEAITVRINDVLAAQIRVKPEDWFWVHNRWKTPRPRFLLATYKRGIALNPQSAIRNPQSLQPFRIVIRASNWLGDAVMSVPAVRAIKRGRPDAHVTILTPAKLADFWKTVPEADAVLPIEPGDSVFTVARKLRGKFEAAVIFPNSLRTALEPWLAGIPRRVGYPGHRREWLLNQILRPKTKKPAPPPRHQVHHYLALAEFIGAEIREPAADLPIRNPQSAIRNFPIGLVPGAEYGPAKRWLPERYAEVVRTIREQTGAEWKLLGVAKDREVADSILAAAAVPVTDLVGKTSLAQLIDELRTCRLVLTNDTGTMHLAAHLGVPVVAIFGSTEPALTGPLGSGHTILRRHVECSPCFLRECPIDFRCMKAVTTESVIAAVSAHLECGGRA